MIRLAALLSVLATVHATSAVNAGGTLSLTLSCGVDAACTGTYELPQIDPGNTISFSIAQGQSKTLHIQTCGPCKATLAKLKALKVTLTVDGVSATESVSLVQKATSTGAGPSSGGGSTATANANGGGPKISRGKPTRFQVVHDRRGDNHSPGFDYPVNFDLVSASAKRVGNNVVFSVTSTQAITIHDGYGNPVAPCVEIPYTPKPGSITPKQLLPSGNIAGASNNPGAPWPKIHTVVHGATISWTVPRTYLFKRGFLWRATAGCSPKYPADVAPNRGYKTFRWVKVK